MKNTSGFLSMLLGITLLAGCQKEISGVATAGETSLAATATGNVKGVAKDAQGKVLPGAKVTVEHTIWQATYVQATTNKGGKYNITIPATPAGSWTAKAQYQKAAYGKTYKFDLSGDTSVFSQYDSVTRNFKWKLSGKKPGANAYYGAHVDLYPFGTGVNMKKVKLVFTPVDSTLIDGSPAVGFERYVEDIAGTYMVKDVPIGKYTIVAKYPGKKLYLDNRHDTKDPAVRKPAVFGKYGYLAETEYNIEFWLSE